MKYLAPVICLAIVAVLVGLVLYTNAGRETTDRFFSPEEEDIIDFDFDFENEAGVFPEDFSEDNAAFEPDVYTLQVAFIADGEDGYIAFATRLDSGLQYEIPVSSSDLGDAYVTLEVGNIIYVEVNSIWEREPPALDVLYPTTITVER